jgi:hypothetical protein
LLSGTERLAAINAIRANFDYFSVKRSARLYTESLEKNSSRTKAGERRLQKIGANECCEPQPVYTMKYWAALKSQPERKQYEGTRHCIYNFVYAHISISMTVWLICVNITSLVALVISRTGNY